jgi:hypothetical protein
MPIPYILITVEPLYRRVADIFMAVLLFQSSGQQQHMQTHAQHPTYSCRQKFMAHFRAKYKIR